MVCDVGTLSLSCFSSSVLSCIVLLRSGGRHFGYLTTKETSISMFVGAVCVLMFKV